MILGGDEDKTWTQYYDSGEIVSVSHIWTKKGNYQIKVKAIDTGGAESPWSDPLSVSMPKSKTVKVTTPLFLQILQKFMNRFLLLEKLLTHPLVKKLFSQTMISQIIKVSTHTFLMNNQNINNKIT